MVEFSRQYSTSGLAYYQVGTGSTILMIHGVGMRAENWHQQVSSLADNHRVVCVDLPGHGFSEPFSGDEQAAGLSAFVSKLDELVKELAVSAKSEVLDLCGHSLGALIVLELAAKRPNLIRSIAAVSAIHNRSFDALSAVQGRARQLRLDDSPIEIQTTLDRWFESPLSPLEVEARELCAEWLLANNKEAYACAYTAFAEVAAVDESVLSGIGCPALYITGADDPNSTAQMSQELADATRYGTVKVVPGAKHMLPLTHAEELNSTLHSFFGENHRQQERSAHG